MHIQIHPNRGRISDPKRFVGLYLVRDMTDRGYTNKEMVTESGRLQLTEAGTSEF